MFFILLYMHLTSFKPLTLMLCFYMFVGLLTYVRLQLDAGNVYQAIDDGVDGEAGGTVNLQFAGDVAAVGDDGVDGDAEVVGNLLVGHSLDKGNDDVALAVAEGISVLRGTEHHAADIAGNVVLARQLLQSADGGDEDAVFNHRMLTQPLLVVVDVMQRGGQLVIVESVLRQVFDDEEFELAQLLVGLLVVLGEGLDAVACGGLAVDECLNVGEECALLIGHVAAYLVGILVVEAHDEASQRLVGIEAVLEFLPDEGQLEVEVVLVAGVEVVEQRGHTELLVVLVVTIPINGEIDDGKEGVGIHAVVVTGFTDGLVAEAQGDAEAAKGLQQVVIITDEGDHLVIGLILFLILHT